MDETPLFIVGMPRSGTTLVEQIVSSHPAVAAGRGAVFLVEPRRFARGRRSDSTDPRAGARAGGANYISLLRADRAFRRPGNRQAAFNFQQLGLIHLLLPNARIIHCRRDPIDTCLSMYFTYSRGGCRLSRQG